MNLFAVDIGNTSVKVAPGGEWTKVRVFPSLAEAADFVGKQGAEGVAFCTTRSLAPQEMELVRGWRELRYTPEMAPWVRYLTPESLGPDRLAAVIAVRALFPGECVLVADAGTALTLDVVDARGVFRGGNISAGLNMRLDALHGGTSRLPRIEAEGGCPQFGRDTASALRAGAEWGMVYEVAGAARSARKEWGGVRVVLTGGDADLLKPMLEVCLDGFKLSCVPGLVLNGIIDYYLNHEI